MKIRAETPMTAAEYKAAREARGTQTEVAAALGVSLSTVAKRETAHWPITREAELALLSLPLKRNKSPKT